MEEVRRLAPSTPSSTGRSSTPASSGVPQAASTSCSATHHGTHEPRQKEFFARFEPDVRFRSKAEQDAIVAALLEDSSIALAWDTYRRGIYASVSFIKSSGRYRLFAPGNLGKGDFNVYRMFAETAFNSIRPGGWASQVLPAGFYGGANAMALRRELFESFEWRRLVGFVNTGQAWFPGVADATRFCIYTARKGGRTERVAAAFNVNSVGSLEQALSVDTLSIPVGVIKEFSPSALAVMELESQFEIDVVERMYNLWPKFGDSDAGLPLRHYMREVDMGTDRHLFTESSPGFPVFEGRMIDQYDYRAKGYRSGRGRAAAWEALAFSDSAKSIQPQWWIPDDRIPAKVRSRLSRYRIGFCDATSPSNERTLVAALVPPGVVCGHKVPTVVFEEQFEWAYMVWLGFANSFVMDFLARKKVALSMSYTVLDSLPFPRIPAEHRLAQALVPPVLRLLCAGLEMSGYWKTMAGRGWVGGSEMAKARRASWTLPHGCLRKQKSMRSSP